VVTGARRGAPPLLVLVGPTAVGKTAVAVRLAGQVPMEVVSADSRQVYRGMDIGTGKPSPAERAAVPHHLLDAVDPGERYHAARFRADALGAIAAIHGRGRLPVVVGGTGLYVRALLKGLAPAPPADPALRETLEGFAAAHGSPALHARLAEVAPEAARRLHPNDRVRVVRALEVHARRGATPGDTGAGDWAVAPAAWRLVMIGLSRDRAVLNAAIAERARAMLTRGMMEEVRLLLETGHDPERPPMDGIGYRPLALAARGRMTPDDALRLMIRDTTRYAKRQMTWFARDPEIRWIDVDGAGGVEGTAETILKQISQEGLTE
jgi:tRNA dimethylallyltransferase